MATALIFSNFGKCDWVKWLHTVATNEVWSMVTWSVSTCPMGDHIRVIELCYSMGPGTVCVCQCVRSHSRISWWIFTKFGTKVIIPKVTTSSWHHPFPYFPLKTNILCQEVLKIHANINKPISASNVCESRKFCVIPQIGVKRRTWWWRQIFTWK